MKMENIFSLDRQRLSRIVWLDVEWQTHDALEHCGAVNLCTDGHIIIIIIIIIANQQSTAEPAPNALHVMISITFPLKCFPTHITHSI